MARMGGMPAVLVATLALGCSIGPRPEAGPEPADPTVRIEVTNRNWQAVTVYAERAGQLVRLGLVSTNGTRTFVLPSIFQPPLSDVRLLADLLGSREAYLSDELQIYAGDHIKLTVENVLGSSLAIVR